MIRCCRMPYVFGTMLLLAAAAHHAGCAWDTPSWSPDGSRIAFATSRSAEVEELDGTLGQLRYIYDDAVYVARLGEEESEPVRVADGRAPLWSPNGEVIAFLRSSEQDGQQGKELWLADARGNGDVRRVEFESDVAWLSSWSPDGSRILAAMSGDVTFPGVAGTYQGYRASVVAVGNASVSPIGLGVLSFQGGAWSPDGKQLALAGWQKDEQSREVHALVVVPVAGGEAKTIMRDVEDDAKYSLLMAPAWDSTGRWIAVLEMQRAVREVPGHSRPVDAAVGLNVILVSPDGAVRKTVHHMPLEFAKAFEYTAPAFSPDGKRLAYMMNGHFYAADVEAAIAEGTAPQEVPLYGKLPEGRILGMPAWYPTGSAIAITVLTPRAWETWAFQPDSGDARRVARVPRPE